ncbi:MAG: AmmeMemoRadiSam system protein B [Chloroflexota bacterium]
MKAMLEARPSPIAGQWYAGDARRLAAQVDQYMDAAQLPELAGEVLAVVAPHAGHIYSGPVAGYAFAAVRGQAPDLVAVVSPMHYPYLDPLLTTAHASYATPLGNIPVDHKALQDLDHYLLKELKFGLRRVAHDNEHSLEIELPFLQRALAKPFRLLPIMVRDQSLRVSRCLGESLARLISSLENQSVLLVASTDLSHFYPQETAIALDAELLRQVEAFDPEGVIRIEEQGKGYACGRGALAAVLFAAKELGADHAQVVRHATSGDVTGDYERVVGYAAVVVTRQGNRMKSE